MSEGLKQQLKDLKDKQSDMDSYDRVTLRSMKKKMDERKAKIQEQIDVIKSKLQEEERLLHYETLEQE